MKYILGLLMLMVLISIVSAQSAKMSLPPGAHARVSALEFRTQVQRELTHYPHGDMLYRRCDVFARMINRRVALQLVEHPLTRA